MRQAQPCYTRSSQVLPNFDAPLPCLDNGSVDQKEEGGARNGEAYQLFDHGGLRSVVACNINLRCDPHSLASWNTVDEDPGQ
jgi:hypothetical protein